MKRKIALILIIILLIQILPLQLMAYATPQTKPDEVRVKTLGGRPSIGYDDSPQRKGYYADLIWKMPVFEGDYRYYNVYYKKNGGVFTQYGSAIPSDVTETRLAKLESGVVYHAYVSAVHAHAENDSDYAGQVHSSPSTTEDEVMFLTGIDVKAVPAGTEELDIIWDDVRYNGQRIGYKIYISQSRDFATTDPIYVSPEDIGPYGAVKPSNNKLIYRAKNRKPGTVYYVKIQPILFDSRIVVSPESKVALGYTFIPAIMTRVSAGDNYDIWTMKWERVTSSVSGTDETEYIIMQKSEGDLWRNIGGQKDVVRNINVRHNEENLFKYKVRVYIQNEADEYGYPMYIESNELSAYTSEAPYFPAIPDIQHSIPENVDEKLEIGSDYIKIIWYAPRGADGKRDADISYDFWITTDPTNLNNPDILPTVSDFQPSGGNFIYEKIGQSVTDYMVAYKYKFEELQPNTTYYIKMIAKKKFLVNINGQLTSVYYKSQPAIEMILTDSGNIHTPTAPSKPPFKIKTDSGGIPYITQSSATVEWLTGWYEIRNEETGEWNYYSAWLDDGISDYTYREIQYNRDIKFGIGYMELTSDLEDYSIIRDKPLQIMGISNPYWDSHEPLEYNITGLKPNKMYLIWMRAYRDADYMSEPSDPVIITTNTDYNAPIEKPAVPKWVRAEALDNNAGIELVWDRTTERHALHYTYYIKWSTEDRIEGVRNEIKIPADYFHSTDVYKIDGLNSQTTYYFWIRAEVSNNRGEKMSSDWSDSQLVTTTAHTAPNTPMGFGIKNSPDAVGKNYITYEWNHDYQGVNYILEIAKNTEYEDAVTFSISDGWEYKIENLTSNVRYYARLYAVDKMTKLASFPTHTVSVKTLHSDDDYDTDTDKDKVIEGPIITDRYDKYANEWIKEIIGVNADRFLETIYKDRYVDYRIDMRNPPSSYYRPKRRRVRISYKLFNGLSQIKENLIIDTGKGGVYTLRPYMLDVPELSQIGGNIDNVIVELVFYEEVNVPDLYQLNVNPVKMVQVDIEMQSDGRIIPIVKLNRPLMISMNFTNPIWYYGGQVKTIVSGKEGSEMKWIYLPGDLKTSIQENQGVLTFESTYIGKMGIVHKKNAWRFFDISSHWAAEDIGLIFSKYDIKSIGDNKTMFYPNNNITVEDNVKFILDILGIDYTEDDYMQTAFKAGLLRLVKNRQYISRQEAIAMLMRLYEIKTGEDTIVDQPITQYIDASEIGAEYRKVLQFAAQKGIIIGKTSKLLAPNECLTRAEAVSMLKRTLEAIGEL